MRTLKFRHWNARLKEMEYLDWLPSDREEEPWMQFTGLLDKVGKEIYEGDILEQDGHIGGKKRVCVYWNEPMACFSLTDMHNFPMGSLLTQIAPKEIIGNIYENPDLLTPPN